MSRRASVVVITMMLASALLFSCESAVNLDVKYTGSDASDASAEDPDGADAQPSTSNVSKGEELEGCPCDQSQGLACCVSRVGPPFCTTDQDRCAREQGAFYRCFGPDPNTESVCCWTGSGEGALTAYAAECRDRLTVCTTDRACPGAATGACRTRTCKGVLIGACGADPPACPPGTS